MAQHFCELELIIAGRHSFDINIKLRADLRSSWWYVRLLSMLHGQTQKQFRNNLLDWFAQYKRDLPWRRTKDPYRIWLSEIMLQQTRVAAALPYYQRFLERFPDVKTLAEAPEEEVLRLWAGLGYYSRARNLQKAARQIVERHGGKFPQKPDDALALAGVGNYTAAAILSIAHGKQLAVLDGNVARVVARLEGIRGDLRSGSRWQELQKMADNLLATEKPGEWNEAMMELGAMVCTPRSPQCLLCPVGEFCTARRLRLTEKIPERRLKPEKVEITLAALVLVDPQRRTLLLAAPTVERSGRNTNDVAVLLSRMWHFPTIQVKADAKKELSAFARKEVVGMRPISWKFEEMSRVRHTVTYREITILPFRVEVRRLPRVAHAKVLALDDVSSVPVSNLTRKVARASASDLQGKKTRKSIAETRLPLSYGGQAQRVRRNPREEALTGKAGTGVIDTSRAGRADKSEMLF